MLHLFFVVLELVLQVGVSVSLVLYEHFCVFKVALQSPLLGTGWNISAVFEGKLAHVCHGELVFLFNISLLNARLAVILDMRLLPKGRSRWQAMTLRF